MDVQPVREQHDHPPPLAALELANGYIESIVEGRAPGGARRRQDVVHLVAGRHPSSAVEQLVGEQHQLRLVQLAQAVEQGAGPFEGRPQRLAAHALAGVHQHRHGERRVTALEGDDLLAGAIVDDRELLHRQRPRPGGHAVEGDVQLAQAQVDGVVHAQAGRPQAGPHELAGWPHHHRLEQVRPELVAQVDRQSVGPLGDGAALATVQKEPHFADVGVLDLDLDHHLAERRLERRRRHEPGGWRLLLPGRRGRRHVDGEKREQPPSAHRAPPLIGASASAWASTGNRTVTLCRSVSRSSPNASAGSSEYR